MSLVWRCATARWPTAAADRAGIRRCRSTPPFGRRAGCWAGRPAGTRHRWSTPAPPRTCSRSAVVPGPRPTERGSPCEQPDGPSAIHCRPGVESVRRSVVAEKPRNQVHLPDRERFQGSPGSPGGDTDTVRVETGAFAQHRAGDAEQAIGHRAQGARVSVAADTQRLILVVARRIAMRPGRPSKQSRRAVPPGR